MEMLQRDDEALCEAALKLLLTIIASDKSLLESLCSLGMVPIVCALTDHSQNCRIRRCAVEFVQAMCSTSALTVQMFVACGGIRVLIEVRRDP
jgi:hypothetical protein